MGGVARILLCHVRSEQKNWMEIGKFDGETVCICDGSNESKPVIKGTYLQITLTNGKRFLALCNVERV